MVFSSLQFIFLFLPIFFGCYYLAPKHLKNVVLLIGSLCFYFIGVLDNLEYFILFLVSIMVDFVIGLLIEQHVHYKKIFLIIGIVFHILCLAAFKYSNFVINELNTYVPSLNITFHLLLPIGVSFYTFQGMSYIIDVYKGTIASEKSLLKFAVYISCLLN